MLAPVKSRGLIANKKDGVGFPLITGDKIRRPLAIFLVGVAL
jgi:hypothetical protein